MKRVYVHCVLALSVSMEAIARQPSGRETPLDRGGTSQRLTVHLWEGAARR
jgi:hypothetical protein